MNDERMNAMNAQSATYLHRQVTPNRQLGKKLLFYTIWHSRYFYLSAPFYLVFYQLL